MNDIAIVEDTLQSLIDKPADYITHLLKKLGEGSMVDGLRKVYEMGIHKGYEIGIQKGYDKLWGALSMERCIAYANGHRDGMFKGTIIGAGGAIVVGAASYGIIKFKKYREKKLEKTNEEVYSDEL